MTIDAAEIAAWREAAQRCKDADGPIDCFDPYDLLDLLDELEKARAERDENKWCKSKLIEMRSSRDAAHALLRDFLPYSEGWPSLRARIAKFLGDA